MKPDARTLDTLDEHTRRITLLLNMGHQLHRAVLSLQFTEAMEIPDAEKAIVREVALDELFHANNAYSDAYMAVYMKNPSPATAADGAGDRSEIG